MEGRQAIKNRSRSPPSLCVWKCGDTSGDFSASRDHHAHAHTTHVFAAFDAPALLFHLPSQPAGEILRLSRLVKKIAPFPVILGLSTGLLVIKPCSKVSMSRLTQVKLSQVMTQDIFSYSFTIKWVNKSWVFLSQVEWGQVLLHSSQKICLKLSQMSTLHLSRLYYTAKLKKSTVLYLEIPSHFSAWFSFSFCSRRVRRQRALVTAMNMARIPNAVCMCEEG